MRRCIDLAHNGAGKTLSNPMVGALLVHRGHIIGEGWHDHFGGPHAEVMAINNASSQHQSQISDSVLYVTLEPCSNFGKTPPCSQLIIESNIKKVVIGVRDPNPINNGKGISLLKGAGIEVVEGVEKVSAESLIRSFLINQTLGRPYTVLKFARSEDGFIGQKGKRVQLSNPTVNALVHKLRAESQGILIGRVTAENDKPELTSRYFPGKNPMRIILSQQGSISPHLKTFNRAAPSLLISEKKLNHQSREITHMSLQHNLSSTLKDLYQFFKIGTLLVEGGKHTLDAFLKEGLWDEVIEIICPVKMGSGIKAPKLHLRHLQQNQNINGNLVNHYYREVTKP